MSTRTSTLLIVYIIFNFDITKNIVSLHRHGVPAGLTAMESRRALKLGVRKKRANELIVVSRKEVSPSDGVPDLDADASSGTRESLRAFSLSCSFSLSESRFASELDDLVLLPLPLPLIASAFSPRAPLLHLSESFFESTTEPPRLSESERLVDALCFKVPEAVAVSRSRFIESRLAIECTESECSIDAFAVKELDSCSS